MNRVVRVARVLLTTWKSTLAWPVAALGPSWLMNLLIIVLMGDRIPSGHRNMGGVLSIYLGQLLSVMLSMPQTFTFAVGLNVGRRTFFLAQSLVIVGQSVLYGLLLFVLNVIEQASNGWGVSMGYFSGFWTVAGYSPVNIVIYTVPMILTSYLGLLFGVIFKRWGTSGVLWSMLGTVMAITTAVLVSFGGWPAIGSWLTGQTPLALAAGWTLLPLVAFGAGGYAILRRAVP